MRGTEGWRKRDPKYAPSPQIDELIRDAYRSYREGGDRRALTRTAAKIRWPKHMVNRRGAQLGLAHVKEAPWRESEVQLLEQYGHLTPQVIARRLRAAGYQRSENAVHIKLTRMRIKQNLEGYSATQLANALGVDSHCVTKFIHSKRLKAERRGTERTDAQGGDVWWITRSAAKAFVEQFPDEVNFHKVEKFWFLDLITDGRICR